MTIVGRPIEGITINDLEWLLTDNGELMNFNSIEDARKFLKENGCENFSNEDLDDSFIFEDTDQNSYKGI